jgi:hypothetical protein
MHSITFSIVKLALKGNPWPFRSVNDGTIVGIPIWGRLLIGLLVHWLLGRILLGVLLRVLLRVLLVLCLSGALIVVGLELPRRVHGAVTVVVIAPGLGRTGLSDICPSGVAYNYGFP